MAASYTAAQLCKRLRKHDKRFEITDHGKGSHKTIYHPDVDGEAKLYTLPYHTGDLKPGYAKDIRKLFKLPKGVL